jgi:hypothetical protein
VRGDAFTFDNMPREMVQRGLYQSSIVSAFSLLDVDVQDIWVCVQQDSLQLKAEHVMRNSDEVMTRKQVSREVLAEIRLRSPISAISRAAAATTNYSQHHIAPFPFLSLIPCSPLLVTCFGSNAVAIDLLATAKHTLHKTSSTTNPAPYTPMT